LDLSLAETDNGTFFSWDTTLASDGDWTIRLTTWALDGRIAEDRIYVTVDNVYLMRPYYLETFGHDPIEMVGRAAGTNFQNYTLEYANESTPGTWVFISESSSMVFDGTLGSWDISSVPSGRYIIRLTVNVTDHDSNDTARVVIDKTLLPGWPQRTGNRIDISSAVLADLDGDGTLEVIIGSTDAMVYVWHHNGTLFDGWPQATSWSLYASPAVADVDDDGDLEIVIRSYNTLYVWNHDGTALPGWPAAIPDGTGITSPVISDLDGDGPMEIILSADYLFGMDGRIFVWDHTGTVILTIIRDHRTYSTPSVGDIDGDGDKEIVCGWRDFQVFAWHHNGTVVSGWPQSTDNAVCDSPKLADLDNDGKLEIISRGWQWVYVWYGNGTLYPGWPVQARGGHTNSGIGDIDGDGELEIVIASYDRMYAWDINGMDVPGFPQFFSLVVDTLVIPHYGGSSAILGDIDGDSDIEIIGSTCHSEGDLETMAKLWAWHHDGTPVAGWPKLLSPRLDIFPTAVRSTSALGDVDNDGDIEIVVGGEDGMVYIWDLEGAYNESNIEWGSFQNDPGNTGVYDPEGPVTTDVSASPNPTNGTSIVNLTANVSDIGLGDSNIVAAEYFVDITGTFGTGIGMAAEDGSFNTPVEAVTQTIDISTWPDGVYTLYIHGQDAEGNWGPFNSTVL
ncbi:MAG: VCBS repeat-containing protein, partial [Thermoplasmata archaeon]|nr:VCBS repeat-containing protein [Thermoplasmata archaeon]